MRLPVAFCLVATLAACAGSPTRFAAPLAPSGDRIGVGVSRIEVREVSLPAYALGEEIWTATAEGALTSDPDLLWADEPRRGVTQELARQMSAITGARVAGEPWPFEELPQARIDVRADSFVAGADGRFRISGQYFVAAVTAASDRAGTFDVSAPIAPESGLPGIAAARSAAVRDLARVIADEGF